MAKITVRIKPNAASAYVQSCISTTPESEREDIAAFLRKWQGRTAQVAPVYNKEKVVAYALNDDWSFLPQDVDVLPDA